MRVGVRNLPQRAPRTSKFGCASRSCTLLRWLVKKLSMQITSCPSDSSRRHRWLPRNPAPPVTTMRWNLAGECAVAADDDDAAITS